MRFVGIMMILALAFAIASIAFAEEPAQKPAQTTEKKEATEASTGREPASKAGTMSRESEDALKGAVSRVNQLMDTASKSAPESIPSEE